MTYINSYTVTCLVTNIIDCFMKWFRFGITSSLYLATQVLQQLTAYQKDNFPRAAKHIYEAFYVDYCLTGEDSPQDATDARESDLKGLQIDN